MLVEEVPYLGSNGAYLEGAYSFGPLAPFLFLFVKTHDSRVCSGGLLHCAAVRAVPEVLEPKLLRLPFKRAYCWHRLFDKLHKTIRLQHRNLAFIEAVLPASDTLSSRTH